MFSIYPGLPATGFTHETSTQQVIYLAQREDAPAFLNQGKTEGAVFTWSLPLRYSGFPVRRRLIRMMLTLHKCGEAGSHRRWEAFTPAADYARSVIDTAMLRGELRCRPSGEMAHAYLMLTWELRSVVAGAQQDKALLRKEVRRRTADFLSRFGTEARI